MRSDLLAGYNLSLTLWGAGGYRSFGLEVSDDNSEEPHSKLCNVYTSEYLVFTHPQLSAEI